MAAGRELIVSTMMPARLEPGAQQVGRLLANLVAAVQDDVGRIVVSHGLRDVEEARPDDRLLEVGPSSWMIFGAWRGRCGS